MSFLIRSVGISTATAIALVALGSAAAQRPAPQTPLRLALQIGDAGDIEFSDEQLHERLSTAVVRALPDVQLDTEGETELELRIRPACIGAHMRQEAFRGGVLQFAYACKLTLELAAVLWESGPLGEARVAFWRAEGLTIAPRGTSLERLGELVEEWLAEPARIWNELSPQQRSCWSAYLSEGSWGDWWTQSAWPEKARETASIMDTSESDDGGQIIVGEHDLVDFSEWIGRDLLASGPCSGTPGDGGEH